MGKKSKKKLPLRKKLIGGYLLCMFTLFPVFCTDGYFNIRHDRYYFFLFLSLAVLVLQVACRLLGGSEEKDLPQNLQAVHAKRTGPWYRRFSFTDWAMLIFMIAATASTVLSQYPLESIFGSLGRNNGLVLLLAYGGVYFIVTRWDVHRESIFVGLASCSGFVSLAAILNFFYLDPLNMFSRMSQRDSLIFISTIGNKNLLSGYLCMTVPAVSVLFIHSQDKWKQVLYLISAALGFSALMCADSDSGFLGVGAFCLMGVLVYIREPGRMKRFLFVLLVMLGASKALFFAADRLQWENKGVGVLQHFLLFSTYTTAAMAVLVLLTLVLYILHRKKPQIQLSVLIQVAAVIAMAAAGLALVGGLVYYTAIDSAHPLSAPWNLFRLDDSWGTHRGFMWRRSMEIFKGFSWKEKLLGSGPDTFYAVFQPYFQELSQFGDSSTNAAHNEYIHYLITQGIAGLGSYLAVVIGSMVHALRCAKKEPLYLVALGAVVGYSAQALVNIAQPITTPLFILFVALAARRLPKKVKKTPYVSHKKR